MAFSDMWFELAGELDLPTPLVQTKLNEALGQIYDDEEQQLWSFQLGIANWLTPGLRFATGGPFHHSEGGIFVQAYSDEVRGSEEAAEAWRRHFGRPLLTEMQIRSPFFSLYNIIHFDGHDTLLLDRPWLEPEPWDVWGPPWSDHDREHWERHGQPYMIYQAYFPTPTSDFKRFFEIKDTMNASLLDYWTYTQRDLTFRDPQRIIFDMPSHVVFIGWDERGRGTEFESATIGFPMYELWPHPLSQQSFTFSYLRRGDFLENPADELPRPLTEDMLKWRTRQALYLHKESQKGETVQRGSGADWRFLAQAAAAEYKASRNRIGKRDASLVDLFFNRYVRGAAERCAPFATINGQLNVGGWGGW